MCLKFGRSLISRRSMNLLIHGLDHVFVLGLGNLAFQFKRGRQQIILHAKLFQLNMNRFGNLKSTQLEYTQKNKYNSLYKTKGTHPANLNFLAIL